MKNLFLKDFLVIIVLLVSSMLSGQSNESGLNHPELDFVPNQIIITFYDNKQPETTKMKDGIIETGIAEIDQLFNKHAVNKMEALVNSIFIASCEDCLLDEVIKDLSDQTDIIRFVEKDYIYPIHSCSNPVSYNDAYPNNTTCDKIEVECGWAFSNGGNSLIGVPDQSGNGLNHNDINSKIVSNTNFSGFTETKFTV